MAAWIPRSRDGNMYLESMSLLPSRQPAANMFVYFGTGVN